MKNRHETPATTPQFGCKALIHSQMRKIMSRREACFVSISVYFCLLLPPSCGNEERSLPRETFSHRRCCNSRSRAGCQKRP